MMGNEGLVLTLRWGQVAWCHTLPQVVDEVNTKGCTATQTSLMARWTI
jgi:hypothetical protein